MLSEEDKAKLIAEETFRYEVRKSLENKKAEGTGVKILSFLNSSFGLWLLSTVVVGFAANWYTDYRDKKIEIRKNHEIKRKLDTEISYRMTNLSTVFDGIYMDLYKKRYGSYDAHRPSEVFVQADCLNSDNGDLWNVFPEFKNRSLTGLLFEIEQLEDNQVIIRKIAETKKGILDRRRMFRGRYQRLPDDIDLNTKKYEEYLRDVESSADFFRRNYYRR